MNRGNSAQYVAWGIRRALFSGNCSFSFFLFCFLYFLLSFFLFCSFILSYPSFLFSFLSFFLFFFITSKKILLRTSNPKPQRSRLLGHFTCHPAYGGLDFDKGKLGVILRAFSGGSVRLLIHRLASCTECVHTDIHTHAQSHALSCTLIHRHKYRRTDTDGQADRQTDEQMDTQAQARAWAQTRSLAVPLCTYSKLPFLINALY